MMPTRWASSSASSRYWVVRKMVIPSCSLSRRTSAHTWTRLTGSSPVVGSSRNRISRVVHQGGGQVETALHPARIGADRTIEGIAESMSVSQLGHPLVRISARQAVQPTLQAQQLGSGLLRVEGRFLQGDTDAEPHLTGLGCHVIAGHPGPAPGRGQQGAQHAHRGRLAGAVGPEEPVDLPGGDAEVDPVDGLDPVEMALETFGEDGVRRRRSRGCHHRPLDGSTGSRGVLYVHAGIDGGGRPNSSVMATESRGSSVSGWMEMWPGSVTRR